MKNEGLLLKTILRSRGTTHEEFAEQLKISRPTLNTLFKETELPEKYRETIETLLNVKFDKLNQEKFGNILLSNYAEGNFHKMAAQGNIVHVPLHAYGGFLRGYANKVFVESLEHYSMPGIEGPHFSFDAEGFSMYKKGDERSAKPGDRLFSIKKDGLSDLVKGRGYVIQSVQGICYKIFDKIAGEKAYFESLNEEEDGVTFQLKEIKGVYFVDFILKKPY